LQAHAESASDKSRERQIPLHISQKLDFVSKVPRERSKLIDFASSATSRDPLFNSKSKSWPGHPKQGTIQAGDEANHSHASEPHSNNVLINARLEASTSQRREPNRSIFGPSGTQIEPKGKPSKGHSYPSDPDTNPTETVDVPRWNEHPFQAFDSGGLAHGFDHVASRLLANNRSARHKGQNARRKAIAVFDKNSPLSVPLQQNARHSGKAQRPRHQRVAASPLGPDLVQTNCKCKKMPRCFFEAKHRLPGADELYPPSAKDRNYLIMKTAMHGCAEHPVLNDLCRGKTVTEREATAASQERRRHEKRWNQFRNGQTRSR
jgi:hypothetical protein